VRRTLDALRADGKVDYAYLGISTKRVYPQLARRFKLPVTYGAWVQAVVQGGPADRAGLRAGREERRFQAEGYIVGGDLITAVDGAKLVDDAALSVVLLDTKPGDQVTLRVYRDGKPRDVKVRLGSRPSESGDGLP
jgi:S1-C subfamily serine protease